VTEPSPTTSENPDEGFGPELFGPAGWTDTLAEALAPYCLPDPSASWIEFYDVPSDVVSTLAQMLHAIEHNADFTQWDFLFSEPASLAAILAQSPGMTVTCSGKVVTPPRSDECIEITALRIAATITTELTESAVLDSVAAVLDNYPSDLTLAVESSTRADNIYLVVYPPPER
jgi:hypothetical protein